VSGARIAPPRRPSGKSDPSETHLWPNGGGADPGAADGAFGTGCGRLGCAQPPVSRDPAAEGPILVVQADGKGVFLVTATIDQPARWGKSQKRGMRS